MVTHRADPAQPLHQDRQLPERPPLDETFETAEFDDVKPRLSDPVLLVEQQGHFAVTLDPGEGLDDDSLGGFGHLISPSQRFLEAQSYLMSS